jgi:hypothetical protein
MSKNTQFGHRIKKQIYRYINRKFPGLKKPDLKLVFDMVFGISKSGDSKISNIARALDESCDLRHTVKRLYTNLNAKDYSEMLEVTTVAEYPNNFTEDTTIALDFSDISKPYAEKMDNLTTVRDGDKGTFGLGYNQIVVTATQRGDGNPTVLANRLFSKVETPDKKSTDVALELLKQVRAVHGDNGVYTQDRYFDNKRFFSFFHTNHLQFVTRAKDNRKLLAVDSTGKIIPEKRSILDLAKNCKTSCKVTQEYWENGQWKPKKVLRIGSRRVFLPCINAVVTLVVVKGFGKIPMMLLTNIPIQLKNDYDLERIFRIYRARWQCEEWIRFVKTAYNLEDIRCLNWISIKNVVAFVLFVNNMLTKRFGYSAQTAKTREQLLILGKPIYPEKAKMTLYMLAEGFREVLRSIAAFYKSLVNEIESDIQLELPL